MTTVRTILRDTTLVLPVLMALGGVYGGWWGAFGMLLTGFIALGNLWVMAWIVERGPRTAMFLLGPKLFLALGLFLVLSWAVDPVLIGLGLGVVMMAVAIAGVALGLRTPEPTKDEPCSKASGRVQET